MSMIDDILSAAEAFLGRKRDAEKQSADQFVADVAAGKITDPQALVKGLDTHNLTFGQLRAELQRQQSLKADREQLAKEPTLQAELQLVQAEQAAANAEHVAALKAASEKLSKITAQLREREHAAQMELRLCADARVRILENANEADAIRTMATIGSEAAQQFVNHADVDWLSEQRRLRAFIEQTQRKLRNAMPSEEPALRLELARLTSKLEPVEAHIAEWQAKGDEARELLRSLEQQALSA